MRNNSIPSVFMHVDITQPLWAFWDIYGNTSRIRILGSCQQSLLRTSLPRQQSNQQLVQVESPTTNGKLFEIYITISTFTSVRPSGVHMLCGAYTGGHISWYSKFSRKYFCCFDHLSKRIQIQMMPHLKTLT